METVDNVIAKTNRDLMKIKNAKLKNGHSQIQWSWLFEWKLKMETVDSCDRKPLNLMRLKNGKHKIK